ncbi:MAG: coproporphyrinogen dehydrogenase HemZ [Firmicutes bacterium HGW-Firmicutes-7]|nr:MAG: coproporphyrinogen dehydrogenase HemZ [Firmicutes bacterium HGW-Firmicutes-7]
MVVQINREDFIYEVKTFLKVYFPNEVISCLALTNRSNDFLIEIEDDFLSVSYFIQGELKYNSNASEEQIKHIGRIVDKIEKRKEQKKLMKQLISNVATQITGKVQPWGILTGIRPTKVVFNLRKKYGKDTNKIIEILSKEYKLSDAKIQLMLKIADKEQEILNKNRSSETNIYIGIPFCPSKCLYCSFTSFPISKWQNHIMDYLNALKKEISFLSEELLKGQVNAIRSIYIGGGTPTSLDITALEVLLKAVKNAFNLAQIEEYTVEAGRPDTITKEKLLLLKQYGVNRISINPQTMNQKTLDLIGRKHTPEDIIKTYDMAKDIGFKTINMDLIVGLPSETTEDVKNTIEQIKKISPNNLTVHTMAIKRGSQLNDHEHIYTYASAESIEEMLNITSEGALSIGLEPYYLYRQKHMVGNFENIGYAKKGHECTYNVEIIEEKTNILALGVGGITKIVTQGGKKIERIENVKDVEGYISRIDEMIDRKRNFS